MTFKKRYKKFKTSKPISVIFLESLIVGLTAYHLSARFVNKQLAMGAIVAAVFFFIITASVNIERKMKFKKEQLLFRGSNIQTVDKLDGFEFERYLMAHFKKLGYKVELTPPKQDYGVDLVLVRGKDRIAVQAKRYNYENGYKVNYKAVQEVAAGKAYYNCNKGIVVTNSFFTNSAKELAQVNQIDLWDRKRMIMEFQAKNAPSIVEYKKEYCLQRG